MNSEAGVGTSNRTRIEEPAACTDGELEEFAHLVRQGFASADERLPGRIRNARWLGLHRNDAGVLTALAAIKSPGDARRAETFAQAGAGLSPAECTHELGWVFVVPAERGKGIATELCQRLLERVPGVPVFATTRVNNDTMRRILVTLGFVRRGGAFPWHGQDHLLFVRTGSTPQKGAVA